MSALKNILIEALSVRSGESVQSQSVNYVTGTICKVCVRYIPVYLGGSGEPRTRDQRIKSPLL